MADETNIVLKKIGFKTLNFFVAWRFSNIYKNRENNITNSHVPTILIP